MNWYVCWRIYLGWCRLQNGHSTDLPTSTTMYSLYVQSLQSDLLYFLRVSVWLVNMFLMLLSFS